jgi:rubredoxin
MAGDETDVCPECGSSNLVSSDKGMVCRNCGLVFGKGSQTEEEPNSDTESEWKAFSETDINERTGRRSQQETQANQESPPQTPEDWEPWYPCPTCESTELQQISQDRLIAYATEDGDYGGDDFEGTDEYIECAECGETLLDEIGRS